MVFLFKKHHIAMILDGTKTQTRRVREKWLGNVGAIHQVRTSYYGKPQCRIRILRRWEERLGDISEEDARAEGGYTRDEYISGLIEMHDRKIDEDSVLKCFEFELYERTEEKTIQTTLGQEST